jgi:pimeloyl-ACP methyl ester carboxylesterase
MAYLEEGPSDGPLALLLHGFPDSAHTWRYLLPALGAAGWHAVAPWLRGYAPTEIPADGRLHTGALVADANALHAALGGDERAVLIGHDWGAVAAYGAAVFAPERWSRVVTMAVPPPSALAGGFLQYDQLRRSWYMFFFQHPLAQAAVDVEFVRRLWQDWSPGYDEAEDVAWVAESLGAPENMAAAMGFYKAMWGTVPSEGYEGELAAAGMVPTQPLLYLHGRTDGCLGVEFTSAVDGAQVIDGAGHFLQVERPDEVNERVLAFLGSGQGSAPG